ncbi:MAG: molybdopterin dinucleotide binding domain-containing protein, partial [Solirubrobacteraceae bacterium]
SSGSGGDLVGALEQLELHFSLDLYVNETNKHAHYILPGTTFYERPDVPLLAMSFELRPTLYATEAVVHPRGEVRAEWRVLNEIARRMGRGGAYPVKPLRWLAAAGVQVPPMKLYDAIIRTGPYGDRFGLRSSGWSLAKLRKRAPHGIGLADELTLAPLADVLDTADGKVQVCPPELEADLVRLQTHVDNAAFSLRAIGRRELNSHNSWMHNAPRLMRGGRTQNALIHPDDAARAGLAPDGRVVIESAQGSITVAFEVTDDVAPGTVVVPHGWGHAAGWTRANAAGGANANALASAAPEDIEPLAGMSILSGIPVDISAAPTPGERTTGEILTL